MLTRCPQCETLYRLTNDQVEAAGGKVRCSRCSGVFNALEHMESQDGDTPELRQDEPESSPPREEQRPITGEPAETEANDQSQTQPIPDILLQNGRPEPHAAWWAAAFLLIVIAALQTAWLDRASLIKDPQGKDFLTTLCSIIGCSLPQPRAPEKFRVLSREMSSHPQQHNTLIFTLVMANKARFAQPSPYLQLDLFDNDRKPAGQRIFTPKEYFTENDPGKLLQPDEAIYITLELFDPGPDISGFEIKFL